MATITFRGITYTDKTANSNNTTLFGTSKPDWLVALGGNNQVFSGPGNDLVLAGIKFVPGPDNPRGFPPLGGEAIFYDSLPDVGNNIIDSGIGDDYVAAGAGNDIVNLGEGNDVFDSGGGNDIVFAGSGDDIIGIAVLPDQTVNTVINADTGDDCIYILSGGGHHLINAGAGNDDMFVIGNSLITAGSGDDLIGINYPRTNPGSSYIYAGTGADSIFTIRGKNLLHGDSGNDMIMSGQGNDSIYAGEGNDVINVRGGLINLRDCLVGLFGPSVPVLGGGHDTVYLGQGKDRVIMGLGEGASTIYHYGCRDQIDLTGLGLGSADITLIERGANTLLRVGSDLVATLVGTRSNEVNFIV
jgi:Ca2+-binding RTX toxin-like protein